MQEAKGICSSISSHMCKISLYALILSVHHCVYFMFCFTIKSKHGNGLETPCSLALSVLSRFCNMEHLDNQYKHVQHTSDIQKNCIVYY